jgi:galactonate dehydratase
MKITGIETIRLGEFPNLIWVRVETDEGITGLGESFYRPEAVEAYLHATVAPVLLGEDPLRIDWISKKLMNDYVGFASSGAEMRAASAIDIALWDLFGRAMGQPVHQMLGGLSRDRIRTYNTCAGYRYVRQSVGQATGNWGIDARTGPYEDLDAFLNRADELAHSLLEQGITGMKIWPFDPAAERTGGLYIGPEELETALEPFEKIRRAVGSKMDVMVELHSMWNVTAAKRLFRAIEPFEPFWFEDPIKMTSMDALAEVARSTRVPICASETIAGRPAFREMMAKHACGVCMLDIGWVGGLSEAKKVATMAEAHQLPVAPHDCTGPIVYVASCQLSLNAPNALIQESVRAFYTGWYKELVTELPEVRDGWIHPMSGPGLGTELLPDITKREDAIVRRSG